MIKQKTIKAWAVISEGVKIPIANCGKLRLEGFEFEPWAIFSTKEQAIKIKQRSKYKKPDNPLLKVVEIEIKIT